MQQQIAKKIPFFRQYPQLEKALPYIPLGDFPTPVEKCDTLEHKLGIGALYVKRDDVSGRIYGGNKVRKLEFLLGKAVRSKAREVATFGFAGSNHALATAIYAHQLGLKSFSFLMSQVNAHYVRRNLLASHYYQAELRHYENAFFLTLGLVRNFLQRIVQNGASPQFIPAGGSCPLGVCGYINAALELKEQIEAGVLPEPDYIYVPFGSMGTSVGLCMGLRAAGIRSRIQAVRVIEDRWASLKAMRKLMHATGRFIRKRDPSFPRIYGCEDALIVRQEFLGTGYAHFTDQGVKAADLIKREKNIILNGAYSAKAFSALCDDAAQGTLADKTVLFWNTYNSRDIPEIARTISYRQLPSAFHRYFEQDVQKLDQNGFDC